MAAIQPHQGQLDFGLKIRPGRGPKQPRLVELGVTGFQDMYQALLDNPPRWETRFWQDHPNRKRGWWKKAAFIAWLAAPRQSRQPATMTELANLLSVSRETLWSWKNKNPEIDNMISRLRYDVLSAHLSDVDSVTIRQATSVDGTVAARELFYRRVADARLVDSGQPAHFDVANKTDDEIAREIAAMEIELAGA